jgi:hypothetical protein
LIENLDSTEHGRKTAFGLPNGELSGELPAKRTPISNLPYELLEHISFHIESGEDFVKWIKACRALAYLGDLTLLEGLANLLGHKRFHVQGPLVVYKALNQEACKLVGLVSFFSRIEFNDNCIPMLHSIEFAKKPLICLNYHTSVIDGYISGNSQRGGRIGPST